MPRRRTGGTARCRPIGAARGLGCCLARLGPGFVCAWVDRPVGISAPVLGQSERMGGSVGRGASPRICTRWPRCPRRNLATT
ncbi:hypothetical protein PR002_g17249 [Phytophthora rubi]|uniref:Uncharacterized protein n=1 Tax=Phytophthora rubi TaxID=129364 RepID=A0A6A3K972_9STRA|nr:hypothetical protein PR002_g17249 [Phytophthora rubi]